MVCYEHRRCETNSSNILSVLLDIFFISIIIIYIWLLLLLLLLSNVNWWVQRDKLMNRPGAIITRLLGDAASPLPVSMANHFRLDVDAVFYTYLNLYMIRMRPIQLSDGPDRLVINSYEWLEYKSLNHWIASGYKCWYSASYDCQDLRTTPDWADDRKGCDYGGRANPIRSQRSVVAIVVAPAAAADNAWISANDGNIDNSMMPYHSDQLRVSSRARICVAQMNADANRSITKIPILEWSNVTRFGDSNYPRVTRWLIELRGAVGSFSSGFKLDSNFPSDLIRWLIWWLDSFLSFSLSLSL